MKDIFKKFAASPYAIALSFLALGGAATGVVSGNGGKQIRALQDQNDQLRAENSRLRAPIGAGVDQFRLIAERNVEAVKKFCAAPDFTNIYGNKPVKDFLNTLANVTDAHSWREDFKRAEKAKYDNNGKDGDSILEIIHALEEARVLMVPWNQHVKAVGKEDKEIVGLYIDQKIGDYRGVLAMDMFQIKVNTSHRAALKNFIEGDFRPANIGATIFYRTQSGVAFSPAAYVSGRQSKGWKLVPVEYDSAKKEHVVSEKIHEVLRASFFPYPYVMSACPTVEFKPTRGKKRFAAHLRAIAREGFFP